MVEIGPQLKVVGIYTTYTVVLIGNLVLLGTG